MSHKTIIVYLMTVFLISFAYGCKEMKEEKKAEYLLGQCKKLEIGMTYEKVIKIMGEPSNINQFPEESPIKEILYFPSPILASTFTYCVIDKKSRIVEEIVCGEGYRITKDNKKDYNK